MSDCSACIAKRIHTEDDWKNHPLARHGFVKEHGFTSEGAEAGARGRYSGITQGKGKWTSLTFTALRRS